MPEKYVPKHRDAPPQRVRAGAKNAVLYSGVAVLATSLSVGTGLSRLGDPSDATGLELTASDRTPTRSVDLEARAQGASRSGGDRTAQAAARAATQAATLKAAELGTGVAVAVTRTEKVSASDPKAFTRAVMAQYGLDSADFDCVDRIWTQESNWNPRADNPHSSAYGIPQALPGSKMASEGADWRTNPETQIRWGLGYIADRYGSACSAWSFKRSHGWY